MENTHEELCAGTFGWYDFKDKADILLISTVQDILKEILPWRSNCRLFQEAGIPSVINDCKGRLFDYILVTGENENSLEQLPLLLEYLKTDGVILLTLDNRYGARRIAGEAAEGKLPFESMERGNNAYTRAEIMTGMKENGMMSYSIYYPVPDWKRPQLLYSDAKLPGKEMDERLVRLQQSSETLVANEYDILQDAVENGSFRFVANSFLLECSRYKENLSTAIFATFTSDRGKDRSLVTVIYGDGRVKKSCMFREGLVHLHKLMDTADDLMMHGVNSVPMRYENNAIWMQYVAAPTLMEQFWECLKENPNEYISLWLRFWETIKRSSDHVHARRNIWLSLAPEEDWGPILEKAYVEMNALNCFYIKGQFVFFDQEYCFLDCPAVFMLYRSIYNFYLFYPEAERYVPCKELISRFRLEKLWPLLKRQDAEVFLRDVRNWDRYADVFDWGKKPLRGIKKNRQALLLAGCCDDMEQVYSFSIFDTLVVRRTASPSGTLVLVQEKLREKEEYAVLPERLRGGLFDFRQMAERIARERFCTKEHEEVTLKEIYGVLAEICSISEAQAGQVMDLEMDTEAENLLPVLENLHFLRNKVEDGRKVVLISDIYMDEQILRRVLQVAYPSVTWENIPIYASGQHGKTKRNGTLYHYVKEREGFDVTHWMHIGSNPGSDVEQARKFGIQAIYYDKSNLTPKEELLLRNHEQDGVVQMSIGHVRYSRINPREKEISLDDIPHPSYSNIPYGLANRYPIGLLPRRVALYGAGNLGKCLWDKLRDSNWHEVSCLLDSNAENLSSQALLVHPLEDLPKFAGTYEAVVIAVLNKDVAEDIRQRLNNSGIQENEIIWIEPPWS